MALLETGKRALHRGLARLPRLRRGRPETGPDRGGPRIAVLGNCQARGIARALEVLLPDARITLLPIGTVGRRRRTLSALADGLKRYDHVFLQPLATGRVPAGRSTELAEILPQARLFPAIVFTAFHPDMVYVGNLDANGHQSLVPSPLHTYHSAITLFGHLRGLSPERIRRLFREDVLALLGYLDGWTPAVDDLSASSRSIGFDLGPDLLRWSRRGAFMHGINHPRMFVMAEIAARLAREAGLAPANLAADAYVTDDLLDEVIWPVYPPIASVYGLDGSYVFKGRTAPRTAPAVLDLDGLITESLALYETIPRERLICHRTEHWSGVPEIRALFDAA